MSTLDERRDNWSRYWASGALHSCVSSFDDNYDDAIGHFWRQVFAPLRSADRVLDIATGNGALPRLILDLAVDPGQLPHLDAVDLAQIDPPWHRDLPGTVQQRICFHPGVAAEKLPFADASFDLVISQYGLEYSDLSRSVAQLRRIKKPGAAVALVLHHVDSLPVRLGRTELLHIDWLLDSAGLLQRARRLLPFLVRLASPAGIAAVQRDPQASQARQQFNETMRELQARADASDAPAILLETQSAIGALAASAAGLGSAATQARWAAIRDGLRMARLRQLELVEHALDAAAVSALAEQLAAPGQGVENAEIYVQNELFGWSLRVS